MIFDTVINVILMFVLVVLVIARLAAERFLDQHQGQKRDFFHHHPIVPGDIVFLGDSLTDGARWDELFPGLPVKNRGINADNTSGVLNRLDDILPGHPAAIFLLIGTNDLPLIDYHRDSIILRSYREILERCKNETPETRVFVQSILPRQPRFTRRIQGLNFKLQGLAKEYGFTFVNLFPHFIGENGGLNPALTNDSLHVLAAGYAIWVDVLTPYIESVR